MAILCFCPPPPPHYRVGIEGEVRTTPPILGVGNSKKHVLKGVEMGRGGVLCPTKGLEGLKIGYDIIDDKLLTRLLKIGNLGTILVTWCIIYPQKCLKVTMDDEKERKERGCS